MVNPFCRRPVILVRYPEHGGALLRPTIPLPRSGLRNTDTEQTPVSPGCHVWFPRRPVASRWPGLSRIATRHVCGPRRPRAFAFFGRLPVVYGSAHLRPAFAPRLGGLLRYFDRVFQIAQRIRESVPFAVVPARFIRPPLPGGHHILRGTQQIPLVGLCQLVHVMLRHSSFCCLIWHASTFQKHRITTVANQPRLASAAGYYVSSRRFEPLGVIRQNTRRTAGPGSRRTTAIARSPHGPTPPTSNGVQAP
jgi:hypothetical protein